MIKLIFITASLYKAANCACGVEKNLIEQGFCNGFQSWSELNNILNSSQITDPTSHVQAINIRPSKSIILTSELDVESLVQAFNLSSDANLKLNIIGVKGIEVAPGWAPISAPMLVIITFYNSQIDFYINGKPASDLTCSNQLIPSDSTTLFNAFSSVGFNQANKYPTQSICPFIFTGAKLVSLGIDNQTDTGSILNLWTFQTTNNFNSPSINSSIEAFYVEGSSYALDTSIMDPLVFEMLQELHVRQDVGSIQTDLFKNFKQLALVDYSLVDFGDFFHKIGIGWTAYLPNYCWVAFLDYTGQGLNSEDYTFPDADLCLFSGWPHQNIILPILNFANLTVCTTTVKWLLKGYFVPNVNLTLIFNQFLNAEHIYSICKNSFPNGDFQGFDFQGLISKCGGGGSTHTTAISSTSTVAITTTVANTTSIPSTSTFTTTTTSSSSTTASTTTSNNSGTPVMSNAGEIVVSLLIMLSLRLIGQV
jgi:hypothetical protein